MVSKNGAAGFIFFADNHWCTGAVQYLFSPPSVYSKLRFFTIGLNFECGEDWNVCHWVSRMNENGEKVLKSCML